MFMTKVISCPDSWTFTEELNRFLDDGWELQWDYHFIGGAFFATLKKAVQPQPPPEAQESVST